MKEIFKTQSGLVAFNLEDEAKAISQYEELLHLIDDKYKDTIKVIIADEKNHIIRLMQILNDLDDISIAKD